MPAILTLCAVIVIVCIVCNRLSYKFGVPALLVFMALGMLFGSDGLFKIPFDNYTFAEQICSIALIFIMFYGGFGTNWKSARPVAGKSLLLSSLGVILTAGLTGAFCYFVLHIEFLESLLIGSVISSTDAASVFSILRSKKLNLKNHTASLLEVESGSNDPYAYMLTIIVLTMMKGGMSAGSIVYAVFAQLVYGVAFGAAIALCTLFVLRRFSFAVAGLNTIFVLAVAVLAYALPTLLGGNGYLSTYIVGIVLGNADIKNKVSLVHFFDGITGLMQILIFFLLGLLAFPSQLPHILLPSLAIALFLTLIARPAAVFAILSPARCPVKQQLLVSWAGLRGASSIVFAIMATIDEATTQNDVFHITFCIVLLSISIQGTLLPLVARKLNMVDNKSDVLKTFNDYQEQSQVQFIKLVIHKGHPWIGKPLRELTMPPDTLLVMLLRGEKSIVPGGDTVIQPEDAAILGAPAFHDEHNVQLKEVKIDSEHAWKDQRIEDLPLSQHTLIVMIKRGNKFRVPKGTTRIQDGDILVLNGYEE